MTLRSQGAMLAARIAFSDPAKTRERSLWLDAHKAYLRGGDIRILQSGPFAAADGRSGALIVASVGDLAALQSFSDGDPFVKAGVYGEVHIVAWTVTLGAVAE